MTWFIVPVKTLNTAKSRLGLALDRDGRERAMVEMTASVLDKLVAHPACSSILVVTRDYGIARLAREKGAEVLASDMDRDLNAAIRAGAVHLAGRGVARAVVLHADLPQLDAGDIAAMTEGAAGEALIARSQDGGTNALAFDFPVMLDFRFGPGSFAAHVDAARNAGLAVVTVDRPGLSRDVDLPQHLPLWRAADASPGDPTDTRLPAHLARALVDERAEDLLSLASRVTLKGFGRTVTFSPKVFLPLTQLCRDVCHYCTFAKRPKELTQPFMSLDEVVKIARAGAAMGCKEALFTLGERPEDRYADARTALRAMGCETTLDYLERAARAVLDETGMLPHLNPGTMTKDDLARLRPVAASMGLMLESGADRLCARGGPHFGSPDKAPGKRLDTIRAAGELGIPFTTGLLVGIGETRSERIEDLLALRDIHDAFGHIQEIIIQNFKAKPATRMASAPDATQEELLWTVAAARLIFGSSMSIQAPPNLSPDDIGQLIRAGVNDWGGVSPLTIDHVNPEAPWPNLDALRQQTTAAGRNLAERLTIYPRFAKALDQWADPSLHHRIRSAIDADGHAIAQTWRPGSGDPFPVLAPMTGAVSTRLRRLVDRAATGEDLGASEIERLFRARGAEFALVRDAADSLRRDIAGDTLTYVTNRNINYTNICYFKCAFCAFSKGKTHAHLRGKPYLLDHDEILRRATEALDRGATEVCLQGGIHPEYDGNTYLDICATLHAALPDLHIHAFSPLEVWHGATTLDLPLGEYLARLRDAGLRSLPGTAAEILSDDVRAILCPDKIDTAQWVEVIRAAHAVGLRTTATIMFGHVDAYAHWASHLLTLRDIQRDTGGFSEFVPLPFVARESPMFLKHRSRSGPDARESILMHAVARLVFARDIRNVQASWVKLGADGMRAALTSGANDMGGTLMDETITRSAGGQNGPLMEAADFERIGQSLGRPVRQRATLYAQHAGPNTSS